MVPQRLAGETMGRLIAVLIAVALAVILPRSVVAQTIEPPPLSAYGDLPSLELVALSPSGRRLAFITVVDETRTLAIIDVTARRPLHVIEVGEVKIRDLTWVGETRVLITSSITQAVRSIGIPRSELHLGQLFDMEEQRIFQILERSRELLPVLMGPTEVLGSVEDPVILVRAYTTVRPANLDLYRIDLRSGRARRIEDMTLEVGDYVLNGAAEVVAEERYDASERRWSLHLRQEGRMRENWQVIAPLDPPSLIGLGRSGASVVVHADRPDLGSDGPGFFDVNLETGQWRRMRFEFRPSGMIFHPTSHRLVGAMRVEAEGTRYVFFEEEPAALQAGAESILGGAPYLTGWSHDLRKGVFFTSGTGDSGAYHLIDLDAGTASVIGRAYGAIDAAQVAEVRAITYAAADGLEIEGYLTLPPGREAKDLPLVVLPHGGPAARDVMRFDWWAQAIASRGYAVLQPNFRGSSGYGEAFQEAGYGEWGRKMQSDLSDGVRHLAGQGVIDPERVCIVGGSYGGYAALAGPTLDLGIYRCAVSVNGVSDLRLMVRREAEDGNRRDNMSVRYWNRFMGAERLGDRSLDERSPAHLAERADAPILLLHGRDDTVVPIEQSRNMAAALRRADKPVEFIELPGEDHWLSRAETRQRMLAESMRFLMEHNPPQ